MKLRVISILLILTYSTLSLGSERSPFTNINFGSFLGWGEYIKVENEDLLEKGRTYFLLAVNGKEYKEILRETKALYGSEYKCRLAEHFVETMAAIGNPVEETANLKLYVFNLGHEVIFLQNVPVTEDNLAEIQFETNFCL